MEDIQEGDKFRIMDKSFPESAKSGERYSIKLTVKHIRLYPDKCTVKLYNSEYPSRLISTKSLDFSLYDEKEFNFSLIMSSDNQYYRVIVIDDNTLTSDTVQDGFNAMIRYEAEIIDPITPYCTQEFHLSFDNVGVRGSVTVAGGDHYTNGEGFGSATLIKGKSLTAVARVGVQTLRKDFTACTGNILSFSFKTPEPPTPEPPGPEPPVPPTPPGPEPPGPEPPGPFGEKTIIYVVAFLIALVLFMGKLK